MNSDRLRPEWIDLTAIDPVACPCGWARRAFAANEAFPGTIHLTQIDADAHVHHHDRHTEVYVILKCHGDAAIELDGVLHPVKPLTAVLIPPGIRHRAVGSMEVLIVCTPKFDPADEVLD